MEDSGPFNSETWHESAPEQDEFDFSLDELEESSAGMNLTPMVDVIFILLVFFLCVSQLKSGALELEIPDAPGEAASARKAAGDPIVVEVDKNDRLTLDGQEYKDLGDFQRRVAELAKSRGPKTAVFVRGDTRAGYGKVLKVLGLLRNAGLTRANLEFDPEAR